MNARLLKRLSSMIAMLILSSCGYFGDLDYAAPDPSICHATEVIDGGFLCALQPSMLARAAHDKDMQGSNSGFGFHAIGFPNNDATVRGIYLHLGGTSGRPYDQTTSEFPSRTWLSEAVDSGFIVIQLAYNNRFSVNGDQACGGKGLAINDCAGLLRREKFSGKDDSTMTNTSPADSIQQRLITLIEYFAARNYEFPIELVNDGIVNWNDLRIGGHSQGAGHALFIAKNYGAKSVCLLSGAYDIYDTIFRGEQPAIADWFIGDNSFLKQTTVRAMVSSQDTAYTGFQTAFNTLSLVKDIHWIDTDELDTIIPPSGEFGPHAATVKDPAYGGFRRTLCLYSPIE
ncbi:MAG: hypothetical protein OEZ58_15740 [Gammaproteobacteria bacterium]|nr:hypothetical protein [Gammaproteobacteria bacterium]MDH5730444.1 hypothetical protein [Gammaproteobacteria bacterium]